MTDLIVKNIEKQLGSLQILKGASFSADKGKIVALLGASGSGKTTLLRCIAGLESPEAGFISIGGKVVLDPTQKINKPAEQRNIGLVFQSYALWPHKTVFDNVAYGLKLRKVAASEIASRVTGILAQMGLGHLVERYPSQLSGGQQQRVAICRALVYEPKILLLDEPLSNLDSKLREEARFWIRKLILDLQICAIIVTHDQTEALAIADRILLLKDGAIVQDGSPKEIYGSPSTFYAAEFLGVNNVVAGQFGDLVPGGAVIQGSGWKLAGRMQGNGAVPRMGQAAKSVIRVEGIHLGTGPGFNSLNMNVDGALYLGDHWEYRLSCGDLAVRARCAQEPGGDTVWCRFDQDSVWVFPEGGAHNELECMDETRLNAG
jgi:iron(III) transport system ATP-binding protein